MTHILHTLTQTVILTECNIVMKCELLQIYVISPLGFEQNFPSSFKKPEERIEGLKWLRRALRNKLQEQIYQWIRENYKVF